MGEIRFPIPGQSSYNWTTYMTAKFRDVVSDWVRSVESGEKRTWSNGEPISTEHLRIAREFLYPANSTNDPHTARMEGRALSVDEHTRTWSVDDLPPAEPSINSGRPVSEVVKEASRRLDGPQDFAERLDDELSESCPHGVAFALHCDECDTLLGKRARWVRLRENARKARVEAARQVLDDEGEVGDHRSVDVDGDLRAYGVMPEIDMPE